MSSALTAPQRIVSLLPSATEILFWLGVGDRVVGVTYECNEPAAAADLPHITNTIIPPGASPAEIDEVIKAAVAEGTELYTLDRAALAAADPDLIVTQDLCRVCALPAATVDDALGELGCRSEVFQYDPMTLDGVLDEIERLATVVDADPARVGELRARLDDQRAAANRHSDRPKVLLLEWPDPPFTPGHWIPDQIAAAGGEPLLAHPGSRSVQTEWSRISASEADVLIVAPCGFTREQAEEQLAMVVARPELSDLPAVQQGRCHAIDADAFIVRPGPRLIDGVDALRSLITRA